MKTKKGFQQEVIKPNVLIEKSAPTGMMLMHLDDNRAVLVPMRTGYLQIAA